MKWVASCQIVRPACCASRLGVKSSRVEISSTLSNLRAEVVLLTNNGISEGQGFQSCWIVGGSCFTGALPRHNDEEDKAPVPASEPADAPSVNAVAERHSLTQAKELGIDCRCLEAAHGRDDRITDRVKIVATSFSERYLIARVRRHHAASFPSRVEATCAAIPPS